MKKGSNENHNFPAITHIARMLTAQVEGRRVVEPSHEGLIENDNFETFAKTEEVINANSTFSKFWDEMFLHKGEAPIPKNNMAIDREQFGEMLDIVPAYLQLMRMVLECFLLNKRQLFGASTRLNISVTLLHDVCNGETFKPVINADSTINPTELAKMLKIALSYFADYGKDMGYETEFSKSDINELVKNFTSYAREVKQLQEAK